MCMSLGTCEIDSELPGGTAAISCPMICRGLSSSRIRWSTAISITATGLVKSIVLPAILRDLAGVAQVRVDVVGRAARSAAEQGAGMRQDHRIRWWPPTDGRCSLPATMWPWCSATSAGQPPSSGTRTWPGYLTYPSRSPCCAQARCTSSPTRPNRTRSSRSTATSWPPGSYLAITHAIGEEELAAERRGAEAVYRQASSQLHVRPLADVLRFFDGLELVEPGFTWLAEWRPEPGTAPIGRLHSIRGGVGRKP